MRKILNTFLVFVLLGFLFACSNPMNNLYSEKTLENDIKSIKESGKLDTSDLVLIGLYIIKSKFVSEKIEGLTYNQILEKAREFKKKKDQEELEQKLLAEKAQKAEAERIERLTKALNVTVFQKGFSSGDFQSHITLKFAFDNKSDKIIRAFTGIVVFTDLFDKEIQKIDLTYDEKIPANKTVNWSASIEFNRFQDGDITLRDKPLENLKVIWKPAKIMFIDGTTFE